MKITITNDDGIIIEVIEHVEEYDLTKPFARSSLLDQIEDAVRRGEEE